MDGGNIDGNTASITVTVQSGGTIASLPAPQKANNTFGGWYTERNGGGNAFTASTQVASNITVYAKWTPSATQGPGGDGGLGNTLTITNAQAYTMEWNNDDDSYTYLPFNDTVASLNYLHYNDGNITSSISLTDAINGTPSVTLIGGKLNVTLGTPKTSAMSSIDSMMAQYPGVTISPSGAKVFVFLVFSNSADVDHAVTVAQYGDNYGQVIYYYADKAVNITGKVSITFNDDDQPFTITMAMNLKAGWNSVIQSYTENDGAIMQSGKLSATDRWVVDEY
jgi:uncharacterized repeat protein (TIGR02543 family)